jgi:hypothetical protein
LEVGPPEQGASLLAQDRLERVLITPQTMTLTPGEERFLSVWVETESGQRYAGDERYLELKWAGPQGYQVAWAGPGRVRVRAPAAFTEETLFISVYRKDLLQADGKTFLSSVATVAMVEPRPEVVVIPEELVGLPVAYDLDQATVLARLALFQLEDLRRALDLDGSDGVITYPALVRIDEGRGITAERLQGQLIVGEGEASILMGRVREVVARRLDVLLLAVEPALPWEVYARYQEELDLGALARQGVIPLDLGRAFGDGDGAVTPQGLRPQSDSQDRRCQWSTPKVEANPSGDLTNLSNLWLRAGVKLKGECKFANGNVVLSPSLTLTLGAGRFVFSLERFAAESALGLGGELKLALKDSVDFQQVGSGYTWLFNWALPLFIGGAFEVYLEYGLPAFSALKLMKELGTMPKEADVVVFGARANGSLFLRYDTGESPALSATPSGGFRVFLDTPLPFQQLAFDSDSRSLDLTLDADPFALGPTIGVGGTALKALKPLLSLVGFMGQDVRLGKGSLLALALHLHVLSTELGYRYVFLSGALGGEEKPGHLQNSAVLKASVTVRSPILEYLAKRNQLIASILKGVDLTILRYKDLEGDHRVLPGRLEALPEGGQVLLRGEYLARGRAQADEVRAYRLSDRSLLATATLRGGDRRFELQVPVPKNCEALSQEERTAVVVLHARVGGLDEGLGWVHLGQVDLCSPIALEVPALRASVGQTAQGQGTARNGGRREVTLGLAAELVKVSPTSLSLPAEGSAPFSVSYSCTEEGSFVGQVAAQVGGRTVARAPAVVTCTSSSDRDARFFWGDPHLITPDGAAYDFHATGEFWAVEHPDMPLQLRFLPMPENPQATYIARLAARLGQARVEVRPLSPGEWGWEGNFLPEVALAVLVEGQDRTADLVSRGYLELPGDGYVAVSRWANVLVNGVFRGRRPLEVVLVYPGANPRPAVAVRAERIGLVRALAVGAVRPQGLAGALRGLMGNANGDPSDDFTTRDGVRLTPPLAFGTLYQTFGRSWEVRSTERLFTDPAPVTRYPEAPPALDPERVRQAEAFCADLPDPYLRQACILDGAVTGDYQGAARAAQAVAEAREGTSGGTTPATRPTSLGLAPNTLRLTASGAGDLTVANRGDQGVTYRLRLVGEGPGLVVDGAELRPEGETAAFTLAPGATRTHRVAYLLQGVEEGAAEAPAALVLVACQHFDLGVDPPELSVVQGRQGAFSVVLTPYGGFRGRVDFTLEGAPPGVELDPATASVEITGGAQVRHGLRVRVGEGVPPGTYSLTLRASSGSLTKTANLSLTVSAAGAGTTWTLRNLGNSLYGVTYGNGRFVAVGHYETILTSPDGVTWTGTGAQTSRAIAWLQGVTYGDGLFVVVGDFGTILTSPDGVTWTERSSETGHRLRGVTYGNGLFVAVGWGTILTSLDGVNWTAQTPGTGWLLSVTYGDGLFVAVGDGGAILTSPDGVTWTRRASGTGIDLRSVTYGNGRFVAVGGNGTILTSPDGVTWTWRASGTRNRLWSVAYGNGLFVAVGDSGTILTSPDGVSWTAQTSGTNPRPHWLHGVTYGDGLFVAVGDVGTILTSPDGVTWTERISGSSDWLYGVAYGNGTFAAVGWGAIFTSPDGVTWTWRIFGTGTPLYGVAYGNGLFVAVGQWDTIFTSPDGVTWTRRTSGTGYSFSGVTYGNGLFVGVGAYSAIFTSPDGVTWTRRTWAWGTSYHLYGVAYGNGLFVAVGEGGTIFTSPDGVTWTERTSGTSYSLLGVAYGNGRFVAVGEGGTILTSSDGVSWTAQTSGTGSRLYGVTYGDGTFVAVGEGGTILTSSDGVSWTAQTSGTGNRLDGVTYGNGTFVAVGERGIILTSP